MYLYHVRQPFSGLAEICSWDGGKEGKEGMLLRLRTRRPIMRFPSLEHEWCEEHETNSATTSSNLKPNAQEMLS